MYCSKQRIHFLKVLGNKNHLKQVEAEIAKKLRTVQPELKVTGSYKKKKLVWRGDGRIDKSNAFPVIWGPQTLIFFLGGGGHAH